MINEDLMIDPNIDARIKSVCLEAEKNYIMSKAVSRTSRASNPVMSTQNKRNLSTFSESLRPEFKNNFNFVSQEIQSPTNNRTFTKPFNNNYNSNYDSFRSAKLFDANPNSTKPRMQTFQSLKKNNLRNFQAFSQSKDYPIIGQKNATQKNYENLKSKISIDRNSINKINSSTEFINKNAELSGLSFSFSTVRSKSNLSNCFECSLHKSIQDYQLFNSEVNESYSQNIKINSLLLTAKKLITKENYKEAFEILFPYIEQGLKHPDVYYLYGEACRKLKKMEEAEKNLLLGLNYKHHSPYIYFSLGMMYMEVGQYKYSNVFFKQFIYHYDIAQIRFYLGRNYFNLKKYLKAVDNLTKAIQKNPNKSQYYKVRAMVYRELSMEDLAYKDKVTYDYLKGQGK